ncbi:MAG TPA: hypothetical protein VNT54_10350 [Solirubrobacteraceae bacterium]|nr:hypothetical protein [Solirubrobacteraceae bacterium]
MSSTTPPANKETTMISRPDFVAAPSALFTDPDGNDLMLHHRYAPYPAPAT